MKKSAELSYRNLIRVTPDERTFHFTVEVSANKYISVCLFLGFFHVFK